jgi:hypothetical protein
MIDCEFVGFIPDDFLDLYLDAVVRRVADQAPYDSNTRGRVERVSERGFSAKIEVEAQTGAFRAEAFAPEPKHAIDRAADEIFRELEHWRRGRFRDEIDGNEAA